MQLKSDDQASAGLGKMRSASAIQSRLDEQQSKLAALLQTRPTSNDSIHRCRVLIKKLRAWIRLVRPVRKVRGSKAADKTLQGLGRELGTARDRQVLKDTLQSLSANANDAKTRTACRKLRRELILKAGAIPTLPPEPGTLAELHLPAATKLDHDDMREGLRANYAKARKLSRVALADTGNAENLHRFRRWVKYLHYQLALLYPLKKSALEQPAMMKELGSTLGQIHDLHVLIESLHETAGAEEQDSNSDTRRVINLAELRMEQLTEDFAAKADLLFAARPKKFMRLLASGC